MSEALSLTGQNKTLDILPDDVQSEPSQIDWKGIWKPLTLIVTGFLLFFSFPLTALVFPIR